MHASKSLLLFAIATFIGSTASMASADSAPPAGANATVHVLPDNMPPAFAQTRPLTLSDLTGGPSPSSDIVRPMVVGGTDAADGVHAFQVGLVRKNQDPSLNDDYQDQFCGGTLVADRFVVTAAHCSLYSDPRLQVQVLVKARKLDGSGERVDVRRIYIHPQYDVLSWLDYDVAVWELARPVTGVSYARLAKVAPSRPGEVLRLTGWGTLSSARKPQIPVNLQQVDLPFVPTVNDHCADVSSITPRMFCAGGSGMSACFGDSGGPLTINRGAGYTELAGIVSWGRNGCGAENSPGVFTNAFIRNTVAGWTRTIQLDSSTAVVEGARQATLTVSRSSTQGVASVDYFTAWGDARENSDFNWKEGTVTFQPGVSTATITIPIVNDSKSEATERFAVVLENPSSGYLLANSGNAQVLIRDDD